MLSSFRCSGSTFGASKVASVVVGSALYILPSCAEPRAARRSMHSCGRPAASAARRVWLPSDQFPVAQKRMISDDPQRKNDDESTTTSTKSSESPRGPGVPTARPKHSCLFRRLGLSDSARVTQEELDLNYRLLSRYYAPENQPEGDADAKKYASRALQSIDDAYEVLGNEDARRGYKAYTQIRDRQRSQQKWGGFDDQHQWEAIGEEFSRSWQRHCRHGSCGDRHSSQRWTKTVSSGAFMASAAFGALYFWGEAGTLEPNVATFATMWALVTFFGSVLGTVGLFLLYAPHRHNKVLAPNATVVPASPRRLRVTGVRGTSEERARRYVEFALQYPGVPAANGIHVRSNMGQFDVAIPTDIPEVGLVVVARVKEGDSTLATVHADLS